MLITHCEIVAWVNLFIHTIHINIYEIRMEKTENPDTLYEATGSGYDMRPLNALLFRGLFQVTITQTSNHEFGHEWSRRESLHALLGPFICPF